MKRETVKYALNFIPYLFAKKPRILSIKKTLLNIINEKKSIIRFGEGELKQIIAHRYDPYQKYSPELVNELKICLQNNNPEILTCITDGYKRVLEYTNEARCFWIVFYGKYGRKLTNLLPIQKTFGTMNITRYYIDFINKSKKRINKIIDLWKKVWNDRDIIFIEGTGTKLGVGNNLFDNAKSIKRIICPPKESFSVIDRIEIEVVNNYTNGALIIIALGPAATVLSYKLTTKYHFQCLDVGHIDVEYMWFKSRSKVKRNIYLKDVNEGDKRFPEINYIFDEKKYESEKVSIVTL